MKIRKDKILELVNLLKKEFEVIAPISTDTGINFSIITDASEIVWDFQNTMFPPKKFFLPPLEVLFTYKRNEEISFESSIEAKKRVILAVRPCDVHALLALDKVFKNEISDPYYLERRKNTILIALDCNQAGEFCFCESLGLNILKEGFDLLLTDFGDEYFVEIGSEHGKTIVERYKELFTGDEELARKPKLKSKKKLQTKHLVKLLKRKFYDGIWKEAAEKCLSCAACTIVCPTCYCYDIDDIPHLTLTVGERVRRWNFCMLKNFTRVAGNIVFRLDRAERLKQFIYHKLVYFKQRYGTFLCVGCGRCLQRCIAGIDFVEIVNRLGK